MNTLQSFGIILMFALATPKTFTVFEWIAYVLACFLITFGACDEKRTD